MAKITLKNVESGFNLGSINENFQKIAEHLQNRVNYRYNPPGEPNQWETQQSANSQRLVNLPDAVNPTEPVTLRQLNTYSLGVQTVGIKKGAVIATNGQTLFEDIASYVPGTNNLNVYVNGVRQTADAYEETSYTSFTLSEPVNAGDVVEYIVNEYPENESPEVVTDQDVVELIRDLDLTNPVFTYTGDKLTSIAYSEGKTKQLNYTGDLLTSVVFFNGVTTKTKTLNYTGDVLTSITET